MMPGHVDSRPVFVESVVLWSGFGSLHKDHELDLNVMMLKVVGTFQRRGLVVIGSQKLYLQKGLMPISCDSRHGMRSLHVFGLFCMSFCLLLQFSC